MVYASTPEMGNTARKKRIWPKVVFCIFAALAFLVVALVIWIALQIPSPAQLRSGLEEAISGPSEQQATPSPLDGAPKKAGTKDDPGAPSTAGTASSAAKGPSIEQVKSLMDDMADPAKPRMRLCNSLEEATTSPFHIENKNKKETKVDFNTYVTSFAGLDRSDPYLETILPMLRFAFRGPKLKGLLDDVVTAKGNGETGLGEKLGFMAKIASAASELNSEIEDLNHMADRGYQAYILTRILEKRPQMLAAPELKDFCQHIENGANSETKIDYDGDAKLLLRLLEKSDLTASEVGYDPNYRSKMNVTFSSKGVQVGAQDTATWLNDVIQRGAVPPSDPPGKK